MATLAKGALLLCMARDLGSASAAAAPYEWYSSFMGSDLDSQWTFWTQPDPAGGAVTYVDHETAIQEGMISASKERIFLSVGKGSVSDGSGRPSVRIQSRDVFNSGLFIVSLDHLPTGCGTWPALWMYGEDAMHVWPRWGEFDIIEGVHNASRVMTSLHTDPHCDQSAVQPGRDFMGKWQEGTVSNDADSCHNLAPDQYENQGCPQIGPRNSVGAGFNEAGGGTYAAEWDPEAGHIRTWFWPSGLEPLELAAREPDPDAWGEPYSFFTLSPSACSPGHFKNMRLVFNIDLCGDLGEASFAERCPDFAGRMSCRELVEQHPDLLEEAFWSIRRFDVYQRGPAMTSVQVAPETPAAKHIVELHSAAGVVVLLAALSCFTCGLIFFLPQEELEGRLGVHLPWSGKSSFLGALGMPSVFSVREGFLACGPEEEQRLPRAQRAESWSSAPSESETATVNGQRSRAVSWASAVSVGPVLHI